MIHKSRKFLAHCFSPLAKNLRLSFAQAKQSEEDLNVLEGKAFLSQKIIREIKNPQVDLQSKSLRQYLVEMIESTTEVPEPSREFMKSMFTTGIPIDLKVFNQDRIQGATQQYQQKTNLFIFCPTQIVTTQMFKGIKNCRTNTLFMGHYGISKSVSVMLYSILSNLIAEYKFKTFSKKPSQLGFQISPSPKIIYYNLESADFFNIQDIAKSILNQCSSQIRTQQQNKFLNFKPEFMNTKVLLKRHYQEKDIEIFLVLDQMSKIIGAMQRFQASPQNTSEIQKASIEKFKIAYPQLARQFNREYFLNSLNFQYDQINRINGLRLGGNQGHQALRFVSIRFLEKLLIKDVTREITDLFLFELQRNFNIPLLSNNIEITYEIVPQKLKKHFPAGSSSVKLCSLIRDYLSQKLIESEGYLITFYSIRLALRQKQSDQVKLQKYDSIQKTGELVEKLENYLNELIIESQNQVRLKLSKFLQKQGIFGNLTDQNKHNIIYSLYQSASNFKGEADEDNLYKIDLIDWKQKTNLETILMHIDRNLFSNSRDGLKTFIPPKLLKKILQPYLRQTFLYFLKSKADFVKKYLNMSSFGGLCETVFIRMVCEVQPYIQIITDKQTAKSKQLKIENSKPQYIKAIPNKWKGKKFDFLGNVRGFIFAKIEQLQKERRKKFNNVLRKDYFFLTIQNYQAKTREQLQKILAQQAMKKNYNQGRAIDFAIMSFQVPQQKEIPQVKITAFDITFGDMTKEISAKIKGFIDVFDYFEQKEMTRIQQGQKSVEIELEFFVLGKQDKQINLAKIISKLESNLDFDISNDKNINSVQRAVNVKSFKGGKPSLLKCVGYATIGDTLVINSEIEKNIMNPDADIKYWRLIEEIARNNE